MYTINVNGVRWVPPGSTDTAPHPGFCLTEITTDVNRALYVLLLIFGLYFLCARCNLHTIAFVEYLNCIFVRCFYCS